MKPSEIDLHLGHLGTYKDPAYAEARTQFKLLMKDRHYGHEPLSDAWAWFFLGFTAASTVRAAAQMRESFGLADHEGRFDQ